MNCSQYNCAEDDTEVHDEFVMNEGALTNVQSTTVTKPRILKRKVPIVRNNNWDSLKEYKGLVHGNGFESQNALAVAENEGGIVIGYDLFKTDPKTGEIKLDLKGEMEMTKGYKIAKNFQHYVELIRSGDHHMYEVFYESTRIKFYIDLDGKILQDKINELDTSLAELENSCNQVVDFFKRSLESEFKVDIKPCIQDSSGFIGTTYKFSRHIVFNGVVFENMQSVQGFFYQFLLSSDDNIKNLVESKFIDTMPYKNGKSTQLFRTIGQTKLNDPRVLRMADNSTFEENLIVADPELTDYVVFECDVDFNNYIAKAKAELKSSKKRVVQVDDCSITTTNSSKKRRIQREPTLKEKALESLQKGEHHDFNQEQHDLVLEMLRNIPSEMYESNEDFYALACMLCACGVTYQEFYDNVFGPYLDHIRINENRESSRATRYTEDKYNALTCDFATYSLIVNFCKKHYNAVIDKSFEKKFSEFANWYYHMKRKFESTNFCLSATEYVITRDPVSNKPCYRHINKRHLFLEQFESWNSGGSDFGRHFFAETYLEDPNRFMVDNLTWTPLRNGEVGGKVFQTTEEDAEGNPVLCNNYNTWTGFLHQRRIPRDTPRNKLFLEIWFKICDNMCSHPNNPYHNDFKRFLHEKFAAIIQFPDELTKVACYFGSVFKGEGKDYVLEMFKNVLLANEFKSNNGSCERHSYYQMFEGCNIHKNESGIFGTFNSLRDRKLMIHVNEYKSGTASIEDFRSAITSKDLIKNEKCKGGANQQNYASFWVTGQDPIFECIDNGDRRWCNFEISGLLDKNEIIPGFYKTIWQVAQQDMINDSDFHTYLFHYYANLQLPEVRDWKLMIPNTLTRKAQTEGFDSKVSFLFHLNHEIQNIREHMIQNAKGKNVKYTKQGEEEQYEIVCGESKIRYLFEESMNFHGKIYFPCPDLLRMIKFYYAEHGFTLPKGNTVCNTVMVSAINVIVQTDAISALKISETCDANNRIKKTKRFGRDKCECWVFDTMALDKALNNFKERQEQRGI